MKGTNGNPCLRSMAPSFRQAGPVQPAQAVRLRPGQGPAGFADHRSVCVIQLQAAAGHVSGADFAGRYGAHQGAAVLEARLQVDRLDQPHRAQHQRADLPGPGDQAQVEEGGQSGNQ